MNIRLILSTLSNGDYTHADVEFYTSGDLRGYITGIIEVFDESCGESYTSEFLFRVYDPDNGNSLTMVSFSETPRAAVKDRVAETWELLNEMLIRFSLSADLKSLLFADIPHNYSIHAYEIRQEDGNYYLYIDYSNGYALSGWTIPEAIAYHDTPDAVIERDISQREAWEFYD